MKDMGSHFSATGDSLKTVSVVIPNEMIASFSWVLGEMIVINAGFSFASDVLAQMLEGKKMFGKTQKRFYKKAGETPPPTVPPTPEPGLEGTTAPVPTQQGAAVPAPPRQIEIDPETGRPYPEPFDWDRCIQFTCTGVIFCGVVQFLRLEVIDVIFPAGQKGKEFEMAVYKTLFNQLIFSPVVRVTSMATLQYIKSRDCEDVRLKIRNDFFEAQAVSYAVKPVGNFLAFYLFPHNLVGQAVMIRGIAFVYNVYFSYKAYKEVHPDELAAEMEALEKARLKKESEGGEEQVKRERAPDGAAGGSEPTTPKDGDKSKKKKGSRFC